MGLVHMERVIDLVRKNEIPEMGDTERLEAIPNLGTRERRFQRTGGLVEAPCP